MVNNLNPCRLRMRSNDNPYGYTPKRKRISERQEVFASLSEAAEYYRGGNLTLSQEKAGKGGKGSTVEKNRTVAKAELALMAESTMSSPVPCYQGTEFERAFYARFKDEIRLPNRIIKDGVEVLARRTYKLTRVKSVGRHSLPPLVDFIAYNDQHWFALECKSDIRTTKEDPRSKGVFFRSWAQISELESPTSATVPGSLKEQAICAGGVRLPSVVVKRDFIREERNGSYTFELAIFSVEKR